MVVSYIDHCVEDENESGMNKQRAHVHLVIAANMCEDETAGKMALLGEASRVRLIHIADQLKIKLDRTLSGLVKGGRDEIIDIILGHPCTVAEIEQHIR